MSSLVNDYFSSWKGLFSVIIVLIAGYFVLQNIAWFQRRLKFIKAVNKLPGPSLKNHAYPWTADLGPIFNAPSVSPTYKIPDTAQIFLDITKEFASQGLVRQWGFHPFRVPFAQSFVMVWDPNLVHDILKTDDAFDKGAVDGPYRAIFPLLGPSILTLPDGNMWRLHRKAGMMAMRSVLEKSTLVIQSLLEHELFPYWDMLDNKNKSIDLFHHAEHLTVDALGQLGFSLDFGGMQSLTTTNGTKDSIYTDICFLETEAAERSRDPIRHLWPNQTNREFAKKIQNLDTMIRDTIHARQKHIKSANDNTTDDLPNDLLTGLLQSETPIEEEY
jgi:cytochrome P450